MDNEKPTIEFVSAEIVKDEQPIFIQRDLANAYIPATKLNNQMLPCNIAKKVFLLVEKLQPVWNFQLQEEKKIFEAHPLYNPELGGCVYSKEDPVEVQENAKKEVTEVSDALKELAEIKHEDFSFEPFEIEEDLQKKIELTGQEIGYLKPFIIFK